MSRVIQEHVKKPLAEELLFGSLVRGGVVHLAVKDEKLAFTFTEAPPRSSKDSSGDPDAEPESPDPPEPEFVES